MLRSSAAGMIIGSRAEFALRIRGADALRQRVDVNLLQDKRRTSSLKWMAAAGCSSDNRVERSKA